MTNGPALQAVDDEGNSIDFQVLEDAGVAFDPTSQHLDLTKDEKRRTTALMMGIQAYDKLIVKDAPMYTELRRDGRFLRPATIDGMITAAFHFDAFIAGRYQLPPEQRESLDTNEPEVKSDSSSASVSE